MRSKYNLHSITFSPLIFYSLIHPLSPRGKLVHWGLEGLAATNAMIDAAINATSSANTELLDTGNDVDAARSIRLRDELYRIAISDEQKKQLQETALAYPSIAEWKDSVNENIDQDWNNDTSAFVPTVDGGHPSSGLRLHNGCCVLHVPSYLRGVYQACQIMAGNTNSSIRWCPINNNTPSGGLELADDNEDIRSEQQHYDATIYCYGSNIFQRSDGNNQVVDFTALLSSPSSQEQSSDRHEVMPFPVQLVRGQSMEVTLVNPLVNAMLCGKYISPLPQLPNQKHRALIGATHEFSSVPMSTERVITDLQTRTKDFAPFRFHGIHSSSDLTLTTNHVTSVDRITCGYRVQSTRSEYGRRPIVGKIPSTSSTKRSDWIFTGLSSRGLLYHALYGQLLAQAILQDDESVLLDSCPDILWWKSQGKVA